MRREQSIYYANRGVERNKKPLKNIIYEFEIKQVDHNKTSYERYVELEKYKFKDQGYIYMSSGLEQDFFRLAMNGFVTPQKVKELIGEKQWSKFCQGKRRFIIQRRVDGKNVHKKEKP